MLVHQLLLISVLFISIDYINVQWTGYIWMLMKKTIKLNNCFIVSQNISEWKFNNLNKIIIRGQYYYYFTLLFNIPYAHNIWYKHLTKINCMNTSSGVDFVYVIYNTAQELLPIISVLMSILWQWLKRFVLISMKMYLTFYSFD